jgi:hypothetical protein
MPLKQVLTKQIFDASNRKMMLIEFKLESRKLKQNYSKLRLGTNVKKLYLVFIVLSLLIPLFTINPSANTDSRLLQLVGANQKADNTPLVFAEPAAIIPIYNSNAKNLNFEKYTLKNNETLDSLLARLTNLKKETITINNPGKEFIAGNEVIIPNENGYLLGYNTESDSREIAAGLSKEETEIRDIFKADPQGYIFNKTDEPLAFKRAYDAKVAQNRYNISRSTQIEFIPQYATTNSSAVPGEDLSEAMNSFINAYQGRRHHDGNGWSMGECVSLVKRWQQFIGAAYGIWPGYNGYPRNAWAGYKAGDRGLAPDNATFGVMVVSDVNSLKPGDILVIDTPTSHTGLATGRYYGNNYEVFDQNSPVGSGAKFTTYSKSSFIAALRYYRK